MIPPIPAHRQPAPRFSGPLMTNLTRRFWLDEATLQQLEKQDSDPYVGELPQAFGLVKQKKIKQVYAAFNKLAKAFSGDIRYSTPEELQNHLNQFLRQNPKFKLPAGWTVEYLSKGAFGRVLSIVGPRASFVLKVFKRQPEAYEEIATGAYLSARKTRNLAKFHVANTQKGWILAELIAKDSKLSDRKGFNLFWHGAQEDDAHFNNYVNGVRVDYGYLRPKWFTFGWPRRYQSPFYWALKNLLGFKNPGFETRQ